MNKKYIIPLSIVALISFFINISFANNLISSEYDDYPNAYTYFLNEQGDKVFLEKYEGRTTLVVFWATWCGFCKNTLPMLDNLQKDFQKLDFDVIAISEDYQGLDKVKEYYKSNNITNLNIFLDDQNQFFKSFGETSIPSAFLINYEGKIKAKFKGEVYWYEDSIRSIILNLIGNNIEMPKNTYIQSQMRNKYDSK